MQDVVNPKPEKVFIIRRPHSPAGSGISIRQRALNHPMHIGNRRVVKIPAKAMVYPTFWVSLSYEDYDFGTRPSLPGRTGFDHGDYALKFDLIKNVPLLLLDDIGAEYLTAWARDEIIEPILQYRMDQELPVFFTSNYDFKLLEKHFTLENDRLKAKRILERIYQVSEPVELISRNLRDE